MKSLCPVHEELSRCDNEGLSNQDGEILIPINKQRQNSRTIRDGHVGCVESALLQVNALMSQNDALEAREVSKLRTETHNLDQKMVEVILQLQRSVFVKSRQR